MTDTRTGGEAVFLSYNHRDEKAVFGLRASLERRGVGTFLDRTHLPGGLPWPARLELALSKASAVAVFIGPEGLGNWQKKEVYAALDRQVDAEGSGAELPVVPVLLPGSDPSLVSGFLRLNTWVDLRSGAGESEEFGHLVQALAGSTPPQTADRLRDVQPYRGLQPFREDDAGFFFGRERFVDDLVDKTLGNGVVAVVGPSGSGKSSVVLAGLVPRLRLARPPDPAWDATVCKPGRHPWRHLADALVPLLDPGVKARELARDLEAAEGGLESAITAILDRSAGTDRLLLVVDQLEELFTQAPPDSVTLYLETLIGATRQAPFHLTLTLRADFYGAAIRGSRLLSDAMGVSQVNLGPLTEDEIRRSITEPARRVGLEFEEGLVDTIVRRLRDQPGNLALLEYALTQLWWRARDEGRFSFAAYAEIGGLEGAIARQAEAVYSKLSKADAARARQLMTRLVRVAPAGSEGSDTRRRVPRAELGEELWAVARRFAESRSRLLVLSGSGTGEATAEVAHEALIRHWDRLREWVAAERDLLLWRQRLAIALEPWRESGGKDAGALLRGGPLREAQRWLREAPDLVNEEERRFVRKSARSSARQRLARRIGTTVALLALVFTTAYLLYRRSDRSQIETLLADGASTVLVTSGRSDELVEAQYTTAVGLVGRFLIPRQVGAAGQTPIDRTDSDQWANWLLWATDGYWSRFIDKPPITIPEELLRGFVLAGRTELAEWATQGDGCLVSRRALLADRLGDRDAARRLWRETMEIAARAENAWQRARALVCAADAALAANDPSAAEDTLARLRSELGLGPQPDSADLEGNLPSYLLSSYLNVREELFAEPTWDRFDYFDTLDRLLEEGRLEEASRLQIQVDASDRDRVPWAFARAGDAAGTLRTLGEATLTDRSRERILARLVFQLIEDGQLDQAASVILGERSPDGPGLLGISTTALPTSSVRRLFAHLTRNGHRLDDALAIVAAWSRQSPGAEWVVGIPFVLAALLEQGRDDELAGRLGADDFGGIMADLEAIARIALALPSERLDQLRAEAEGRSEEAPRLWQDADTLVVEAMKVNIAWGDYEQAAEIARSAGLGRDDATAVLASRLLLAGRLDEAIAVADRVGASLAESMADPLERLVHLLANRFWTFHWDRDEDLAALEEIGRVLDRNGLEGSTDVLLAALQRAARRGSGREREVSVLHARLGRFGAARRLALLLPEPADKLYAYSVILTEYERARNPTLRRHLSLLSTPFPLPPDDLSGPS